MDALSELGLFPFACGGLFILALGFLAIAGWLKWIRIVDSNEALIVTGVGAKSTVTLLRRVPITEEAPEEEEPEEGASEVKLQTIQEEVEVNFRIVRGGMAIVVPLINRARDLDLGVLTLDVKVEDVLSIEAVPITVDGIVQIHIGSDDTFIATAAVLLLDLTPDKIRAVAMETLMGHLRAVIGQMSVLQVYKDREEFSRQVQLVAFDDMAGLGLDIKSFVIKDISDKVGYIESLGEPEIAAKKRDARVAKADANRIAEQRVQEADKAVAETTKDTNVAIAQYDAEVAKERAVAERAEEISLAEQDKTLEEKKAQAAEQAAKRREQELEAEVRRPADADLYAAEQQAEGVKATGFADAEVTQKTGEATAEAEKAKGIAEADVTRAQRLATAAGIEAELLAEAKGRRELAESLNEYGDSALRLVLGQELLAGVPAIAKSYGDAFANIDQIRLIDFGGDGGGDGGPVERFLDTLPKQVFKFLQMLAVTLGTPVDDLAVAWITKEAADRGVEISPEEQEEIKEQIAERVAEAGDEAEEAEPDAETPEVAEEETPPEESEDEEKTPTKDPPSEPEEKEKPKATPRTSRTRKNK